MDKRDKVALILGAGLILAAAAEIISSHYHEIKMRKEILACTIGQDLAFRETVGTATFSVHFKDGEFASYNCISVLPPVK